MSAPVARGPLGAALLRVLAGSPDRRALVEGCTTAARGRSPVSTDDDVQLTLYLMYELHYGLELRGGDLDDGHDLEWDPGVLRARALLERRLEAELRETYPVSACPAEALPRTLFDLADGSSPPGTPSVAGFIAREATLEQVRESLVLRSPYQLKEGDPQTWAIPRLHGRAKAALVEIQADEYGGGRPDRMHSTLFARSMRALGLDDAPNTYLDHLPAVALASVNVLSMFGLHRRLRGALCGHLAAFEMTSSLPAKRVVSGMQRLGLGPGAVEFFDEHIEADAVHEQIAAHDLCGGLVADEPHLVDDVLLGASACLGMDARVADHAVGAWRLGRSALRSPLPAPVLHAVTA